MIPSNNHFLDPIDRKYLLVLLIAVFTCPLLWGLGIFSIPMKTLFPDLIRPDYWTFFVSIVILEWGAFALIAYVCRPDIAKLLHIHTDWLRRYRYPLGMIILGLFLLAWIAPTYLYSDSLPETSIVLRSIGPVSSIERVFFVLLALTAGICEEVIFRGFGISVLERYLKRKDLALIVSSLAFMSLHGIAFLPWYLMLQYFIIGLIFGFFFQKYRRLDILILVHFLIDALIVVFVP